MREWRRARPGGAYVGVWARAAVPRLGAGLGRRRLCLGEHRVHECGDGHRCKDEEDSKVDREKLAQWEGKCDVRDLARLHHRRRAVR